MEFTNEQIQEILANEETSGTFLEAVANTEQGKSYLNNFATTHFDKNVGTKIGEIYGNIDNDLKELGFEKKEGVRTFDFVKSTISNLKEQANASNPDVLADLKAKNQELQSQLESNEGTKYFKDLLESTKKTANAEIENYKSQIEEFKTGQVQSQINGELTRTISNLSFDETIKKPVLDSYIKTELSKLSSNAKVSEDGSITYYDENGEIIVNKKTMLKADSQYILNERLKDVIAEKRTSEGSGGDGRKEGKVAKGDFSTAKNQQELNTLIEANLLADGYVKGSEKYQEKFSELLKANRGDLPIR